MKEFDSLLETIDTLLGPSGCPWDREQTMKSIRCDLIEEASELIEAIDLEDNSHIREELGDLFFVVLFLARLAEKEKRCQLKDALTEIYQKLVRRHPHVFGEAKVADSEAVMKQWAAIKKEEKSHRKSALDGIPKDLPALARAQKVSKKIGPKHLPQVDHKAVFTDEKSLGLLLLSITTQAQKQGLDAEHSLRAALSHIERAFRETEKQG